MPTYYLDSGLAIRVEGREARLYLGDAYTTLGHMTSPPVSARAARRATSSLRRSLVGVAEWCGQVRNPRHYVSQWRGRSRTRSDQLVGTSHPVARHFVPPGQSPDEIERAAIRAIVGSLRQGEWS